MQMELRGFSIYDYIQYNASNAGSVPAIISADRTLTHRQFLDRVDQLATGLVKHGIVKGDRICILAQNSIEYLELYGACAKTGAIAYPINWRLSAAEVKGVLDLADPKMLVVGAGHLSQLEESEVNGIQVRAIVGPGSAGGFISLDDLYKSPNSERVDIHSNDPFAIISTAAMAGVPRGAVLTHSNMITAGFLLINALGLGAEDCHLAVLPFYHITGLGLAMGMIQVGGKNVVFETFDPAKAAQMMDEHNVSLIADFPPILSSLLDARQAASAKWEALKYVIGLDAPDVIQRLYTETGAKFWTGFGQSETTGLVTLVRVDTKPGTTGRPLPLIRVRCVDETGSDVPAGEVGEIAVQGPVVFTGYWNDPDATAYTFRYGWHHTGDLGKFDVEGFLYYAGRKPEKELIKSGGENVYPAEVEQVLLELPEVAAVCVIGVPDAKWGEAVKAVIVLSPGKTMNADQVSAAVAERIASYKKPRYVEFVDALPHAADGKIDREAVKASHGAS
jgi:acyl-CoA synthetase (AMP-forming)/AMP-acid ligase II